VLAANAGGFAGKLKDGALGIAGLGATVSEISGGFKDAKEMAGGLFGGIKNGLAGMKDGGGIKGGIKSMFGGKKIEAPAPLPKTDDIAGAADKTKGVKSDAGKGIKGFLKGLGDGFASIGKQFGNVVKGAIALGLAGLALGAGFALALQMVKDVDPLVMITFAGSIGIFGVALALMGKMGGNVIKGALALGIVALSLIPAAFAFSLLEGISVEKIIAFSIALPLLALAAAGLGFLIVPIALGVIALTALGVGMMAVAGGLMVLQAAEGGMKVFESLTALAANTAGLGGLAVAMAGIAYGLGLLAVAATLAAPGLILASFGLATMILPLTALSMIASTGAINMLGNGLKLMGDAGPGLGLVAMSMMGIGAGLGMMALGGLAAMPIIGMLIALATVAPALVGLGAALGGMFGGEGGGKKEDKMDTLIAKIDTLIGVASKGGVINMDGKKVGEVVRQGLNTTGIR